MVLIKKKFKVREGCLHGFFYACFSHLSGHLIIFLVVFVCNSSTQNQIEVQNFKRFLFILATSRFASWKISGVLIGYGCFIRLPLWQFYATNLHHAIYIQTNSQPPRPTHNQSSNKLPRPLGFNQSHTYTNICWGFEHLHIRHCRLQKKMTYTHKTHIKHKHTYQNVNPCTFASLLPPCQCYTHT